MLRRYERRAQHVREHMGTLRDRGDGGVEALQRQAATEHDRLGIEQIDRGEPARETMLIAAKTPSVVTR